MTISEVLDHLAATAAMRANIFGADDSSVVLALQMRETVERLYLAVRDTLDENRHLADGENCTLIRLKRAMATVSPV